MISLTHDIQNLSTCCFYDLRFANRSFSSCSSGKCGGVAAEDPPITQERVQKSQKSKDNKDKSLIAPVLDLGKENAKNND